MTAPQQITLLPPKIPLVTADGHMNSDWYAFLASRLVLLGTGDVTLDQITSTATADRAAAIATATSAADLAVITAFAL